MKCRTFHLGDVIRTLSYRGHQTNQSGFHHEGDHPIIDQGQRAIAGYTSSVQPIRDVPVVIFGDHTRIVKFATGPFVVGADGVKLLKSSDPHVSDRLLYWLASAVSPKLPTVGYGRHFAALCDAVVTIDANHSHVAGIVSALDKCEEYASTLDNLIAAKREQKRGLMQQLLTGKVRFPGISEPWKTVRLGDVVDLERGVSYSRERNLRKVGDQGIVRLLRATNIQDGALNFDDVHVIDAHCAKASDVLETGDIAICIANGSKSLVGKFAVASPAVEHSPTVVGAFCARARVREPHDPMFVAAFMESRFYRRWINALLAGTNINNLKPSDIASTPIVMPCSVAEIRRIVGVYVSLCAESDALCTQRSLLRRQRRGLMERLLSGDIAIASAA